jgi:hypothetical protein
MNSKLLLGLALVLSGVPFGCSNTARADGEVYQNTNRGFQLVVPEGWTATETNFSYSHYGDEFLTINSQRPHLAIRDQHMGGGFGGVEQMHPGEVYVSIGCSDGPGGPTMRPDSVTNDLLPLLSTNHISPSSEPGLSALDFGFFKRGHWWSISGYMREPVTEANRRKVMALLESVRFLDAPVGNVSWAESLAWRELPENIRVPGMQEMTRAGGSTPWPVVDYADQKPQSGLRSVLVKKADLGYSVKFTVDGVGTWGFLVLENGKVIQDKP